MKRYTVKLVTLLALSTVLCACAASDREVESVKLTTGLTMCTEPRPEVCTREYRPVCRNRSIGCWLCEGTVPFVISKELLNWLHSVL